MKFLKLFFPVLFVAMALQVDAQLLLVMDEDSTNQLINYNDIKLVISANNGNDVTVVYPGPWNNATYLTSYSDFLAQGPGLFLSFTDAADNNSKAVPLKNIEEVVASGSGAYIKTTNFGNNFTTTETLTTFSGDPDVTGSFNSAFVSGTWSDTLDASGRAVLTHTLGTDSLYANAIVQDSSNVLMPILEAVTDSNLTFEFYDITGDSAANGFIIEFEYLIKKH